MATGFLPRSAKAEDNQGFGFKDGDLICFLGNTVIERAQKYGHVEAALTLAAASEGKSVKFRNLGWSGDTVFGHARSYFGPPKEGFTRLSCAPGKERVKRKNSRLVVGSYKRMQECKESFILKD